jgi:putative membrane protein
VILLAIICTANPVLNKKRKLVMLNLKILTTAVMSIALSLASGCTPKAQQDQDTSEAPSSRALLVQATENASPTESPVPSGQTNLSSSDKQFMTETARGGLAEVQLGKLASQRGTSSAVKEFAQRMVQDHTQVNAQLKQLAESKGVTLPTSIGSENQKVKQQLSKLSGTRFNRAYVNHMIQDHEKDISSFQRQAQEGQDPDVKAFAEQTLPTLQEHLQMAQSIAKPTTRTSTPTSTNTPTPTPTNTP